MILRKFLQPDNNHTKLVQFITGTFPMPLGEAENIASKFEQRHFLKGEYFLKQGKTCNEYYFLADGYARSYTHDLDGNDVTTAFYGSGQIVCELFSFFKRQPSKENITSLTQCDAWCLSFDKLQEIFHAMPLFREFGRAILVNAYAGLKTRMMSMLQETAEERYTQLLKSNPGIFQHAPLKQIASYLGVTDTSLSRIRKEFAKNNPVG